MRNTTTMAFSVPKELGELINQKAQNLGISKSLLIATVMQANIREEGLECLRVEKGIRREPR